MVDVVDSCLNVSPVSIPDGTSVVVLVMTVTSAFCAWFVFGRAELCGGSAPHHVPHEAVYASLPSIL